ncbi:1-deoxy-D-xylulose-5-phosphate synthase [bacterium SCN 57-13]|mgnify:CR=1 FL=1|nr:1-deoxy-D-xylulose-5-phosphate synthase [Armatimonadota bacterium]ODU54049.1 MAG: 1-deoxy-D-xylulose-5-phosphate synthase [bacterium SCN 57-13]
MESVYPFLSQVACPTDLHKFSDKELAEVAKEVRQAILDHVSKTGGHFSSNLGTVELTVAMYAAYNIPPDKVVWDTGHQAYPHKMLTGRLDRFDTLRKHKGLSGFLKRDEHELDVFGAGHAGTAVSAALGFAVARDRLGTDEKVVAVTGDAAIASGMSWEALNHAGELGTDLCVVLNDNRMSIAPNVGALTNYLATLRSRTWLQNAAHRAKNVIEKMPEPITKVAAGLRHGITHYLAPESTGTIFEEIGWEYIGPVDGHDLPILLEVFRNVRELKGPTFVHAITVKGKGYDVAEEDSRKWHAAVPFDLDAGDMVKAAGPVTFTQAFGDAAVECAENDPKVVAITAAMPDGTGLAKFSKEFPDRYYDVGIAEQHAVTFAAGLAAGGIKPFCAIYSTFLQRGFDQVLHDVCIQKLPVRFFMDRAGLVGDDGPTHHGAFDISMLSFIPNIVLLAPRDTTELREMTRWMKDFDALPSAVRYPRGASDDRLPEGRTPIELGKAEVLSEGDDLTIAAVGSMTSVAWEAAKRLEEEGIRTCVINARFLKPIDAETILSRAQKSGKLITIEENAQTGGFGEAVRAAIHEANLDGKIEHKLRALPDHFIEHGAQPIIRNECGLSADSLVEDAHKLLAEKKGVQRR